MSAKAKPVSKPMSQQFADNYDSEKMFDRFRVSHWMPFAEAPK
jgi:hypothetical protein